MAKYVFNENTKYGWRNMPLLYLYIFEFIAEKAGKFDQEVSSKLILEIWHRHIYHVPRLYDSFFLEEMQYFGLMKREESSQRFIFYGSQINKVIERLSKGAFELNIPVDAPLLYVYIYSRMVELFGQKNKLMTGKQLINIWRTYIPNVPRIFDYHLLTEMCNFGLIRRIDSQKYIFYGGKGTVLLRKMNNLRLW